MSKNKDNTYTVIYKKEKTELSQDYPFSIYKCCKNIILPNSITKINLETFKNCIGLENITLPNSISEIGNKVFFGCTNLKTAPELPATTLKSVCYHNMFYGCTSLKEVYCKPITPPAIGYYYNDGYTGGSFPFNKGMKIYVPRSSFNTYTGYTNYVNGTYSDNWFLLKSYIEPYDF